MANIKATLNPQKKIQVTQYRVNTSTLRLGDLFDVNTNGASDGGLLVYNNDNSVFEVTSDLTNTNTKINGGHY